MKVQLVRREALDTANMNIATLISHVVTAKRAEMDGACPYINDPTYSIHKCKERHGCESCVEDFFEEYRNDLLRIYTVKG